MKRFTIMLAALLSAMTLFAQGKTVNESLKLRQFNSVDISHVWNVQVRYGLPSVGFPFLLGRT